MVIINSHQCSEECYICGNLQIASALRRALDTSFPVQMGVRIIAEPGRYFVTSAFSLASNVIAKRTVYNSHSQASGNHP